MRFSGWRVWWSAHAVSFCGKSARADTPRLSVSRPVKRVKKARPSYEVSARFGAPGDRSRSCWAVSFSTSTIGPPQQGQRQVAKGAVLAGSTTDELGSEEVVSNCWHKGNSFERRPNMCSNTWPATRIAWPPLERLCPRQPQTEDDHLQSPADLHGKRSSHFPRGFVRIRNFGFLANR